MREPIRFLGWFAVAILTATVSIPALARCDSAFALPSPGPIGIAESCDYCLSAKPNFTTSLRISFWSLGAGDPAELSGDDSGSYTVRLKGSTGLSALLPYDYSTSTTLEGVGMTAGPFYNYSGTFHTNWAAHHAIDGCAGRNQNSNDLACSCVLLEDQWNGVGYFSILSSLANDVGDFNFGGGGVSMEAIPRVRIRSQVVGNGEVDLAVNLAEVAVDPQLDPSCDCSPLGFRIYSREVTPNSAGPLDRQVPDGPWVLEGVGSIGGADAMVHLSCPEVAGKDYYLGATLLFPDGFETQHVSANSTRVTCKAVLADPVDLSPKRRAPQPLRPTRR